MIHKKLANGFSDLKESFTVETEKAVVEKAAAVKKGATADEEDEFTWKTRVYLEIFIGCAAGLLILYLLYHYIKSDYAPEYLMMVLAVLFFTVVMELFAAFVPYDAWAYGLIGAMILVLGMMLVFVGRRVNVTKEVRERRRAAMRPGPKFLGLKDGKEGFIYYNGSGIDSTLFDRPVDGDKILASVYYKRVADKAAAAPAVI